MVHHEQENLAKACLSRTEIEAIEQAIALYPHPQAAAIDALLLVQKHRGWISDPLMTLIAQQLSMTESELEGIASFYSLIYRRPVGRYVIKCCDSVSCWLLNGAPLYRHLQQRLGIRPGQTTADGRFTLLPCVCLGDCNNAPVMMINDCHYNQLTITSLDQIIDDLSRNAPREVDQ